MPTPRKIIWLTPHDLEDHFIELFREAHITRHNLHDPLNDVYVDPVEGTERFIRTFAGSNKNREICLYRLSQLCQAARSRRNQ